MEFILFCIIFWVLYKIVTCSSSDQVDQKSQEIKTEIKRLKKRTVRNHDEVMAGVKSIKKRVNGSVTNSQEELLLEVKKLKRRLNDLTKAMESIDA